MSKPSYRIQAYRCKVWYNDSRRIPDSRLMSRHSVTNGAFISSLTLENLSTTVIVTESSRWLKLCKGIENGNKIVCRKPVL